MGLTKISNLGGTWVNVGWIPKKLFHTWGLLKTQIHMAKDYGWDVELKDNSVKWEIIRRNVQNHIKSINFGYVSKLRENGVDYINAKAYINKDNKVMFHFNNNDYEVKSKYIIIATGGRPRYMQIKNSDFKVEEEWITSDDLFALDKNPGKTLVVGGGYIAIEWAGFLKEIGNEVIMINRSTFLRAFDNTIAGKIMDGMVGDNLKAFQHTTISDIEKIGEQDYIVDLLIGSEIKQAKVNTILFAIGRDPNTSMFSNSSIRINSRSMKIEGRKEEPERTSIDHIYALGDVVEGVPELMPVAQKSGKLLAHRLYHRNKEDLPEDQIIKKFSMDYSFIPTTVFSNVEYSYVGLNEEEANKKYGEENIEIYHIETTPLELTLYADNWSTAYMKIIWERNKDEKVLGIHYLGPNAGEVIGGFAVAMKLGLKKSDLNQTLGVHPTVSEDLFNLDITKRSGKDYIKTDCWS